MTVGSTARSGQCQDNGKPTPDSPETASRLFSALNPATLQHEPGSVLGAAALVAGTTIGAGILALPYATQVRGPPLPLSV